MCSALWPCCGPGGCALRGDTVRKPSRAQGVQHPGAHCHPEQDSVILVMRGGGGAPSGPPLFGRPFGGRCSSLASFPSPVRSPGHCSWCSFHPPTLLGSHPFGVVCALLGPSKQSNGAALAAVGLISLCVGPTSPVLL